MVRIYCVKDTSGVAPVLLPHPAWQRYEISGNTIVNKLVASWFRDILTKRIKSLIENSIRKAGIAHLIPIRIWCCDLRDKRTIKASLFQDSLRAGKDDGL